MLFNIMSPHPLTIAISVAYSLQVAGKNTNIFNLEQPNEFQASGWDCEHSKSLLVIALFAQAAYATKIKEKIQSTASSTSLSQLLHT